MRILIVNYEYPPVGGGASNASRFLAEALVQQGHQVSVVTSAFREYRGVSNEGGVCVHRIPARRKSIHRSNPLQMLCFAGSALVFTPKIVRRQQVESAIAFFTVPSGLVSYWLKLRYEIPYIVSLRGGDVPGLDPELTHIHRLIRRLRRRILHFAKMIVANSSALVQLSESHDPFPVSVIPNGVDSTLFHPAEQQAYLDPDENLQVLFVGRLQNQKNLALLLEEIARLQHENGTVFTLNVAGDGPLANVMRQKAEQLGLGASVVWHGWLTKTQLIVQYRLSDCFVNPSLYEGMPNTVLEAMACGLPVIASRIPGNEAVIVDRQTGILFPLGEPKQLGDALTYLANNRSVAISMGSAGRTRVINQFSWEAVAKKYVQALEKDAGDGRSLR